MMILVPTILFAAACRTVEEKTAENELVEETLAPLLSIEAMETVERTSPESPNSVLAQIKTTRYQNSRCLGDNPEKGACFRFLNNYNKQIVAGFAVIDGRVESQGDQKRASIEISSSSVYAEESSFVRQLLKPPVLDSGNYKKILFEVNQNKSGVLSARLTIRGVRHDVDFRGDLNQIEDGYALKGDIKIHGASWGIGQPAMSDAQVQSDFMMHLDILFQKS